jgi:hypothetical protein
MQIIGNPTSCWELIAQASRCLVALGYHTITDTEPKDELDEEIHAAVAWCSQFDSVMSLLLLRPRCLPSLNVNPMSIFEIFAMELIPIHYKILDLTLEAAAKRPVHSLREEVAWLRSTMSDLLVLMDNVRGQVNDHRFQ